MPLKQRKALPLCDGGPSNSKATEAPALGRRGPRQGPYERGPNADAPGVPMALKRLRPPPQCDRGANGTKAIKAPGVIRRGPCNSSVKEPPP